MAFDERLASPVPDHGDGLLGLVLSGSAGRAYATGYSDLDVCVVLTDEAAAGRVSTHSAEVDEAVDPWSELTTVPPFGSDGWWYRWSYAWAPVLLDRTGGELARAVRRQATLTPDEADEVLLVQRLLDGDVGAVREAYPRVRAACAAHDARRGHTRTVDMIEGWGPELALFG